MAHDEGPPRTPDGRYIVVRGRLWRATNLSLSDTERQKLVDRLMEARRDVKAAKDDKHALVEARRRVNAAKVGLGERGDVWWTDSSPDFNRHLVGNTPYRDWFTALSRKSHAVRRLRELKPMWHRSD